MITPTIPVLCNRCGQVHSTISAARDCLARCASHVCVVCGAAFDDIEHAIECAANHGSGPASPMTDTPEDSSADALQGAKATNPKDAAAFNKAPLHLVPASFKAYTAMALAEGAMKYGSWNWRAAGVRASVYVSALERHVAKWFNGEEFDPETGVPHLANAAACLAVLIDSKTQLNLTDDRPPRQHGLPKLINTETVYVLEGLRQKFGGVQPVHYTINWEFGN